MKQRWQLRSVFLDYNCIHAVVGITVTDNVLATTTIIVHFTTLQQTLE